MWIVHYWFLEAGLPREIDGFAFHPYKGERPPEKVAVDKLTDWLKPFDAVDADSSFDPSGTAAARKTKLCKEPEMWITEWGWRTGARPSKRNDVASYLPQAFILNPAVQA